MPGLTVNLAENIVRNSLYSGYSALVSAGESAKNIVDRSIDIATEGDKIVGTAMLKKLQEYGVPFVVYSEEFGRQQIGNSPKSSAVYDDIDGTDNFKYGRGELPHGSIIGIFNEADPEFNDCLSSGFLEFNSGNLYFASRGRGAHVVEGYGKRPQLSDQRSVPIKTSGKTELSGLKIANDQYMVGDLAGVISDYSGKGHWVKDFASKALHIAKVADGTMDIFVSVNNCANHKKKCTAEELGPGYLMVREAGGAVLDFKGRDIGSELLGMGEKKTFSFVVAATDELGRKFVEDVGKNEKMKSFISKNC